MHDPHDPDKCPPVSHIRYGGCRYDDDSLAAAAAQRATELLGKGGPKTLKQLTPLLWAFGRQGHFYSELMSRVEQSLESKDMVSALGQEDLRIIIDAFNRLGSHGPGIKSAAERLGRLVPELKNDHVNV